MKKRYIFSAVAILIVTVFVMMGCGSSSNIGSDNNGSNDNGPLGTENDRNWGDPFSQSRSSVPDTMKFSFLVAGDPQPDVVHYYNNDTDRIMRIRGTVNYMNGKCSDASCIGAVLVGDLTEHTCCQEVIAYRQMFEDSYPGHDGGSILTVDDDDYTRYSGGSKFKKSVFPLIGNHDDPTHGNDLCDWDASCSTRADQHCHSTFVQDYIRARIRGSDSLYNVSKLLNSDGLNYFSYDSGDIYAWEWGSYHFINTGMWAGFKGSGIDDTDTGKLNQLKKYLEMNIGDSGKPVLIFQHLGWTAWNFKDGWWTPDNSDDLINVLCRREDTGDTCNPYNVIGIFSGHVHETAHKSIYAGTDKDNYNVYFDNYLVDDAGPGSDNLTGFFQVELDYNKENSEGNMTVWKCTLDWNAENIAGASKKFYMSKVFNLPLIDWEQGEPNNVGGTESCAAVGSKGRFNDLDCSLARTLACRDRDDIGALSFSTYKHTWPVAQAMCDNIGKDFARISTVAEQREFIDLYKSTGQTESVWVNARSPWVHKAELPIAVGQTFGDDTEGAGITMADIDGNGRPDLIELHLYDRKDDPHIANYPRYSIGWNLDEDGKTTDWSPRMMAGSEDSNTGGSNQGAGIAAGLINDNNITDLVVFYIAGPGINHASYSIGWDINKTTGAATSWSDKFAIRDRYCCNPGDYLTEDSAGAGLAIGDIDNNGKPDLLFYNISVNSDGLNKGKFLIGMDINSTTGGIDMWGWKHVRCCDDSTLTSSNNKGGGVSLADIDGNGQLDIISYFITDRGDALANHAYYRIGWNPFIVADEVVVPSWTRHRANFDVGNRTHYGAMTVGDIDGDDRPDLIVASVIGTHPDQFRYAVARNLDKEGNLVTQHLDENGTLVPGN